MPIKTSLSIIVVALLISACTTLEFPGVYRVPIEQGNILTGEMLSQLEPGLTESQVEYILGSPLIRDPFTPERWDYAYELREPNARPIRKRLSVYFEDGRLAHYESNVRPGELDEGLERRRAISEEMDPEEDPVAPPPAHEDTGTPAPTPAPAPAPGPAPQ